MERILKTVSLLTAVTFMTFVAVTAVHQKMSSLKNRDTNPDYMSTDEVKRNLDCLAMNIYREAASEPFEGKVAVAQVTLNRVESGQFPKEICAVVYQRNTFMSKVVCQFSWYCDRALRKKPEDDPAYDESYKVAKMVFLENFRLESMREALYYHADYVSPNWPYKRIAKIGNHIFYKG